MPLLAFDVIGVAEKIFNFDTLGICHFIKGENFIFPYKELWQIELELSNKGWLTAC